MNYDIINDINVNNVEKYIKDEPKAIAEPAA